MQTLDALIEEITYCKAMLRTRGDDSVGRSLENISRYLDLVASQAVRHHGIEVAEAFSTAADFVWLGYFDLAAYTLNKLA